MPVIRVRGAQRRQVYAVLRRTDLQYIQHLQRRESLPRGWKLKHIVAVVVSSDWLYPLRFEFGQIGMGHHAPISLHLRNYRIGNGALIERISALLLN